MFISARKGTIGYHSSELEAFSQKAGRQLKDISRIIVYPQRDDAGTIYAEYDEVSAEAMDKSVRMLRRWGRGLRRVFRPKA